MPNEPDSTAVRVALWRALHVLADPPPHVLSDEIGLRLAAPGASWRNRPDMSVDGVRGFRAWIVARARFVEDLVTEAADGGIRQYVLLGAGLDSFAQRRPELGSRLNVFEVDRREPQEWKRGRLLELGFGIPPWLRLVPVDFEGGESWLGELERAGFSREIPALVASTGVSMYLSREANLTALRELAALVAGTRVVMTFQLPEELVEPEDRPGRARALQGARASGHPFVSFFTPSEILALAREAGFREARHVSGAELGRRYFAARSDGLRPSSGEDFLVATV